MATVFTAGGDLNVPNPLPSKQTASANYLDFSTGWAQQYLPELYEQEVERYGNRMLSGFLSQVGAEEAMSSDLVRWSEQGRLHIQVETHGSGSGNAATNKVKFKSTADAELFRLNDTVLLYAIGGTGTGKVIKGIVTAEVNNADEVVITPYTQAALTTGSLFGTNTIWKAMVYGSEFKKGDSLTRNALTPGFNSYTNKPIIIRDRFIVNGSDAGQIGWVEVSGESGQSGYLWYMKAEGDTRSRFNDYLEMSMIESERAVGNQLDSFLGTDAAGVKGGTEGLFQAITNRGHIVTDLVDGTFANDIASFDDVLTKFDAEGSIEENMLYLDRDTTLKIDDMLGDLNKGSGPASFGVFNNSDDMAVNLGFTGFRRGSYDFYKTDWKYLNDKQAYGGFSPVGAGDMKVAGCIIPAGVSTVYDEGMGRNIKRPFLHVRYRASQADDRKLKSWITGSVGGNITSDEDAMIVNYLSERCLVVQAANNFMLLKR